MLDSKLRNICIYGLGGVGGYFGSMIAYRNKPGGSYIVFLSPGASICRK